MDKSWIQIKNRLDPLYIKGVKEFIEIASHHIDSIGRIRCPCQNCNNCYLKKVVEVRYDLLRHGMAIDYTQWIHHGEPFKPTSMDQSSKVNDHGNLDGPSGDMNDDIPTMLDDMLRANFVETHTGEGSSDRNNVETDAIDVNFTRLVSDAQTELYPGCKSYSKLSFLLNLVHNKIMTNSSIKSFNINLELLKKALPEGETLPKSYYEVKKIMRDLGLGYIKIDACPNDCILYWKENENLDCCLNPACLAPRWKVGLNKSIKIPEKVLRYFPIKERLQRLFMSKEIAKDMRWHKEKRVEDDVIRHPADAKAWKEFDNDHNWFAKDSRNVRLGLASDGFNPFGNMSTNYSMWPVVLVVYNLPPWKCMKETFFILAMLIPGKTSPGNDIDVYLRPLIDELKELWEVGIETYDAFTGEKFRLHAALLWTINDFPAYAMLSGWSTKGKLACPVCNKDTSSLTLKHGGKQCYGNHRRFLDQNHTWRKSRMFNGKPEHLPKPKELSGDDILEQLRHVPESFTFGKPPNTRKRKRDSNQLNWTKKSIFFELPYWKKLKLRHNCDIMHIEKNICENILGTLLNIEGKTKDNDKARLDLEEMGIRKELHLQRNGGRTFMPPACYTLTKPERKIFCQWLKDVKFPDGYASNLARCVNLRDDKVSGMKSHDYHVFLQRLLPIVAKGFLNKDLYHVLFGLSNFFKELCAKAVDKSVLNCLHRDIVLILCKLELIYPPSFFVIMVHLAIHLSHEVELGGPVHYRWMYPFERFLRTLKNFVKNKAQPEGSIAEAYIAKECLTFCSLYLRGVETKFNQEERNYEGDQVHDIGGFFVFTTSARPLGASKCTMLSKMEFDKIHWYILNNSSEIDNYLSMHKEELTKENPLNVEKRHEAEFSLWFKDHVTSLYRNGSIDNKSDLYALGLGPDRRVSKYSGIIVKGIRFHTSDRNQHRTTQNNGVMVEGEHNLKDVNFYGILQEIIELDYLHGKRVYVFKCDWWDVSDNRNGIRDDGKLVSVNISRRWYADQPFVLASQTEQVFYIDDIENGGNWKIVQRVQPRNLYNVPEVEQEEDGAQSFENEPYQQTETGEFEEFEVTDDLDLEPLNRTDTLPEELDANSVLINNNPQIGESDDEISDEDTLDDDFDDDDINNMNFESEEEDDA